LGSILRQQCLKDLTMLVLLGFGGVLAGTVGGLLGIGGGILIMPLLRFVVGLHPAYAAGTCVVAVFFTTLGGGLKHLKLGHISIGSILPVVFSGLFSSVLFSILFMYFTRQEYWLDMATGIVFSFVALRMLWEGISQPVREKAGNHKSSQIQGSVVAKVVIGAMAGVLPGLLGIGTGAVLVPSFAFALNAPIKIAVGSSLACFSLNALASSVFKLAQGVVQVPILVPLCAGTLIGSRVGATLNGRLPSPLLKVLFGLVFVYVAYKYAGSGIKSLILTS
jgi:uncharacterized membrane protein YfcA